jgi:hypothetical protein
MGKRPVPKEFSDYFRSLYAEAHGIMVQRQEGYGPGNIEQLGPYGVMSRLSSDKCSRILNEMNGSIAEGKAKVDHDWFTEGVRDALMDIANYAMILIALGEEEWSTVSRAGEEFAGYVESTVDNDEGFDALVQSENEDLS